MNTAPKTGNCNRLTTGARPKTQVIETYNRPDKFCYMNKARNLLSFCCPKKIKRPIYGRF